MKGKIKYLLFTIGCGAVGVLFLVFALLSLLVPTATSDIVVKEPIRVSASVLDREEGSYVLQISGSILNERDDRFTVEAVRVTVSDGKQEKEFELDGFVLESRLTHEILSNFQDHVAYDRVKSVTVVAGGKALTLANSTATLAFRFDFLIWLVLSLLAAHVAIRFGKRYYYALQEEQMARESTSATD